MDISTKELFSASVIEPLVKVFSKISDKRFPRGVRYKLKPILILLFLSKLGGADEPVEIADWVSFRFSYLKKLLDLDWKRSPHEVTWQRILNNAIEAGQLEMVFSEYVQSLSEDEQKLLSLDGKVLRSTMDEDDEKQLHLLALQEVINNLVIEQTALDEGENEISAAKRLIKEADVEGKIVAGDAMFANREISKSIVEKGGDYLWKLKKNQGRIYEAAEKYFGEIEQMEKLPKRISIAESWEKGHGRIEHRRILSSYQLANQEEFPYLEQVCQIRRKVWEQKSGKQSEERIYVITSMNGMKAGAEDLMDWTRKQWSIENGLHYRRDVTFKEDRVRRKSLNGGQVMAILNNVAIGLLRKLGWENLAKARRYYNAKIKEALDLIIQPLTV